MRSTSSPRQPGSSCARPKRRSSLPRSVSLSFSIATRAAFDAGADVGLLRLSPQHLPAGGLRHPEDVLLFVVVTIVQGSLLVGRVIAHVVVRGGVADPGQHDGLLLREGVGDEFEEDQPQHQVHESIRSGTVGLGNY